MIAHACDERTRRVLLFSDISFSGHYLESFALFLYDECCNPLKLSRTCCVYFLMCEGPSIGGVRV